MVYGDVANEKRFVYPKNVKAIALLDQISVAVVRPEGIEPPTDRVETCCSIR
jgi:hypothetical protein